jgi:hypothetical protein
MCLIFSIWNQSEGRRFSSGQYFLDRSFFLRKIIVIYFVVFVCMNIHIFIHWFILISFRGIS